MGRVRFCGNIDCSVSTGICESLTFGSGYLDDYGYWEVPCSTCARAFEKKNPQYGPCWPFAKKKRGDKDALSRKASCSI